MRAAKLGCVVVIPAEAGIKEIRHFKDSGSLAEMRCFIIG